MAFRPPRDALGAASRGVAQALGVGRARQGGKDFARERGSHRPQGTRWRDDESRASRVLHSAAYRPQPKAVAPRWFGFDLESQDLQADDQVNHSDGVAMNGFV